MVVIPFVTMSRKSYQRKNYPKLESPTKLKSNFMIIKGVEMIIEDSRKLEKLSKEEESEELSIKVFKTNDETNGNFDFGSTINKENQSLMASQKFKKYANAVNKL